MIDRLLLGIKAFLGGIGGSLRARFMGVDVTIVGATPRTLIPHVAFALALIVPVLLLCALIAKQWVASEQNRFDGWIEELAANVTEDLARTLDERIRALRAMATSPALDQGDYLRFEGQARTFLAQDGFGLLLRDRAGQILVNTLHSPAAETLRPSLDDPALSEHVRISDLIRHGDGRSAVVVIEVPVLRAGAVRFVLSSVLPGDAFDGILRSNGVTGTLMATIVDRQGLVISHSLASHAQVGERLMSFEERRGEGGRWFGQDAAGEPLRMAYRRLPRWDWLISVGMTQAAFLTPLKRTLCSLLGLTLALLLLAFALTAPILKRVLVAQRVLAETAALLHLAQEAAGAGAWDWDMRTGRVTLSARNARMHGLSPSNGTTAMTVELSLKQWEARVFPEDLPALWQKAQDAIAARSTFSAEFRTRDAEAPNGFRWIQSFGSVIDDGAGPQAGRMVGLHLDVTERCETEEALRTSEARLRVSQERLALALDSSEDGLFDWNIATDETWTSKGWLTKLGYRNDVRFRSAAEWTRTIHPDDKPSFMAGIGDHLAGHTSAFEMEYRQQRTDGSYFWVLARGRVTGRDTAGRALRMVGTVIDVSRRKEAELRVAYMAQHDALTGLPNRYLFNRYIEDALRDAALTPNSHAVLACDLDRFKVVNDIFGHHFGDRLLCSVAARIRAVLRPSDGVARLGGDEFAVVLSDIDGEAAVRQVCERIIAAIDQPLTLDGLPIDLGISIGVSMLGVEGLTAEEAFQRADMALYDAKADGRNTYRLYDARTQARVAMSNMIALDMKEAIRRGDFSLVYQPVIDVTTGAVASFEALMRWRHPEYGAISPSKFIPVAEETGLIVPLGAWALAEASREATTWPASVRVGVNVSPIQFRDGLDRQVLTALAQSGLPASRLKLEVTESLLMQDSEAAVASLHRLRDLGVRIALDDFGTGYSSLSYLRRFPFDKLKIDRSFVRDIAHPDAAAIVRAMVQIGERLGMGIVAEGVETEEQLQLIRREGCTEVQGFLFSRPLPSAEARAFANEHCIEVTA